MPKPSSRLLVAALFVLPVAPAMADPPAPGTARPELVLQEKVKGLPGGGEQEVRVLRASFQPGDKTPFHSHRFPVTVLINEGTFTLEMEGREPLQLHAGQAYVEPAGVRMTGYNRADTPLKVTIFYVSTPDTPFLDPVR